jgi:PadR family transcriptional regulator, regulatory protein PadR
MLLGLLPGTLDVLVLKALADGANHGYGVARWIHETTDQALVIEDGALYTALHRLEKNGLLRAEWGASDANRRAKYYSLTTKGHRALRDQTEAWWHSSEALFKVLGRKPRKASS